jgi:hypothetical protein
VRIAVQRMMIPSQCVDLMQSLGAIEHIPEHMHGVGFREQSGTFRNANRRLQLVPG